MFGVREEILRHYNNCKDSPAFLVQFNRKIRTLVKTVFAEGSVDYWRMIRELKTIADASKKRGFSAKQYIRVVIEYVERVTSGIHKELELNTEYLRLQRKVISDSNLT